MSAQFDELIEELNSLGWRAYMLRQNDGTAWAAGFKQQLPTEFGTYIDDIAIGYGINIIEALNDVLYIVNDPNRKPNLLKYERARASKDQSAIDLITRLKIGRQSTGPIRRI